MPEIEIGKVIHYFGKIDVAALALHSEGLSLGDVVHIQGRTTDFTQRVESMQVEHQDIQRAEVGQDVAIKVNSPVRQSDIVYKVID